MRIAALGGCGIQGRTAVHDLAREAEVGKVVCVNRDLSNLDSMNRLADLSMVEPVRLGRQTRPTRPEKGSFSRKQSRNWTRSPTISSPGRSRPLVG